MNFFCVLGTTYKYMGPLTKVTVVYNPLIQFKIVVCLNL